MPTIYGPGQSGVTTVLDTNPTASTAALRDASGRSEFADPVSAQDAATKNYVDLEGNNIITFRAITR